jgi:folate-binding protein YgfZ
MTTQSSASCLYLDRSDRCRLELSGPDRVKFLHNLTTNDVKRLAVGHGQETFVTSPQGKTLGYATLLAIEDRLLFRTDPEGLKAVLPHFQKYGIFDDVAIQDVRPVTFEFHLSGSATPEVLQRAGCELPEALELRHRTTSLGGVEIRLVRESPIKEPGFTLIGPSDSAQVVCEILHREGETMGLRDLEPSVFEALRIEHGTPVFGRDVTVDNLPQEVGRDPRAISFVKGCYLGQETVARIDALGHVNKVLRGFRFGTKDVPSPGAAIEAGNKTVGTITSSALSVHRGIVLALGYIRAANAAAGTEVMVAIGPDGRRERSIVTDLPMPPEN